MGEFNLYDFLLIRKAIFSKNINEFFKRIELSNTQENNKEVLKSLNKFLNQNKNIYDKSLKKNIVDFASYFLERADYLSLNEKNEELNKIKVLLNSQDSNNYLFLKRELAYRDYGISLEKNKIYSYLFKFFDNSEIDVLKSKLYKSIAFDFNVLNLLYVDNEYFEKRGYFEYVLKKDFYRTINYFILNYEYLFLDEEFVNKLNYIIGKNEFFIDNYNNQNKDIYVEIDNEFKDIQSRTNILIKKKLY